jgi:hypothetical protein
MKLFYTYIFFLSVFIFIIAYWNIYKYKQINIEDFISTSNKTILLLGDSVLNNNIYTSDGNGVCKLIQKKYTNSFCYAVDNTKIVDVYTQLNKIPISLNNLNTYIFLSVGANDLLFYYKEQDSDLTDNSILTSVFTSYKTLIKSIQTKLPICKLILLDIYYPYDAQYKLFYSVIKGWNEQLYLFANKNSLDILKISTVLRDKTDFSYDIEPSDIGSIKIADSILSFGSIFY